MLIAATDRKTSMLPFDEQIRLIAEAKPDMIILSESDLSPEEYRELAKECLGYCEKNGVKLCAYKFEDVAKELGIKGIFVDLEELMRSKPSGFDEILTTVRSEKEARDAESKGATMLIFRDVFDLSCKSCRNAKGLAKLRFLTGEVDIPVIGAGGIFSDVFFDVLSTEAAGICMREGFMRTKDPSAVVNAYRKAEDIVKKL